MIVIDTAVLVDYLRGHEGARRALHEVRDTGTPLVMSVLTKVEILAGMPPAEEPETRRLLEAIDSIAVDDDIAERAGTLAEQYLRSHPGIETVDYVVAATALALNASLWTRNVKHFPMFPGLDSPY